MYQTLEHLHDGEIFQLFWNYGLASSNPHVQGLSFVLILAILISVTFTVYQIYEAHHHGGVFKIGSLIMQMFWVVTLGFLFVLSMPQEFVRIFNLF